MHKTDNCEVFSLDNDDQRYVLTLLRTENDLSPLELEQGKHVNIFNAISIDGNVVIIGEVVNAFNKICIDVF